MYTLGVRRDFIARHFLIGGDWGAENSPNSHHYRLELELEGDDLDEHGFLVDILDVDRLLDKVIGYYKDRMLNDLPEFRGLNPSLEQFARLIGNSLREHAWGNRITGLRVVLWEDSSAWAACRWDLGGGRSAGHFPDS